MRTIETRTETLQGAAAESGFGMHSVQAQKIVIDVLNDGTLERLSRVWLSRTVRPTFETTSRSAERSRANQTSHESMAVCLQARTRVLNSQTIKVTVLNEKRDDEDQNGKRAQVGRSHLLFLRRRLQTS